MQLGPEAGTVLPVVLVVRTNSSCQPVDTLNGRGRLTLPTWHGYGDEVLSEYAPCAMGLEL